MMKERGITTVKVFSRWKQEQIDSPLHPDRSCDPNMKSSRDCIVENSILEMDSTIKRFSQFGTNVTNKT